MSLKSVSEPEKNIRLLEFFCDRAAFDAAVTAVYKRNIGKISIPGFRPGKAPQRFVEKMYGDKIFHEEAIEDIVNAIFPSALAESGLNPVSRPEFDIVGLTDEGLTLSAKFYVKPEVVIDGYKSITVKKSVDSVTDEAVDSEISSVRERNARSLDITDRPAKSGDTVIFDYSGSVDGEKFEGGTAESQSLELGSGHFIPGFEDQVVGKSIDEDFVVSVTFPEDYNAAELAGKAAEFACKIHSISEKELPELDDDFAADVSEFKTFDEYKADVRAKLEKQAQENADNRAKDAVMDKLIELAEIDIPEVMIENEVNNELQSYANRLSSNGLSMEMYLQYTGMTMEQMKEQFKPNAEKQVKLRLILEKIGSLENIEATDDEVEAEYADIASNYKMEIADVKARIYAEDLKDDIKVKKAMELVEAATTYEAE